MNPFFSLKHFSKSGSKNILGQLLEYQARQISCFMKDVYTGQLALLRAPIMTNHASVTVYGQYSSQTKSLLLIFV